MQSDNVYYNLHKKIWSIKRGGRVREHAAEVIVVPMEGKTTVEFVVSEPGRQRVLREQRKNVHAYVRGDAIVEGPEGSALHPRENAQYLRNWSEMVEDAADTMLMRVTYNPYQGPTFTVAGSDRPVNRARYVFMDSGKNLWALNPRHAD